MKVSQICYVNHYQELVESIKRAALDEDEKTIVIESDITIKETILIENCKNLTITSSRMPVMKGGTESEKWIQKGNFLTMKLETEPRILLINGEWRKKSCYPAEGYLELTDQTEHEWMNSRNGGWDSPPTMEELTHITVQKKDIPPSMDIQNADLRVIHTWDESVVSVECYDEATGRITTKYPMAHPAGAFNRKQYIILNTKYGLKPGSWCYDRTDKLLCYAPYEHEKGAHLRASLPAAHGILKLVHCENVTVENLQFQLSNAECGTIAGLRAVNPAGAVQVEQSENVVLRKLVISYSGGQAIKCLNTKRIDVNDCVVSRCASGGIVTYECETEVISHNIIRDVGLLDFSAIPIHAGGKSLLSFVLEGEKEECGQTAIRDNIIEHAPYCGITCSGGPHRIENNRISNCMQKLNDGAAIYCSRACGTVIKGNVVSDISSSDATACYLDELSENCIIDGNVTLRVGRPLQNHIARNNKVVNNTFVNDGNLVINLVKSLGYRWKNNTLCCGGDIQFNCKSDYSGGTNRLEDCIRFESGTLFSLGGRVLCNGEEMHVIGADD